MIHFLVHDENDSCGVVVVEGIKAGETLKKHKDKNVLVYCERGTLGASAARILAGQGFTKAVNLRGGVTAWRAEGLPLAKDAARAALAKADKPPREKESAG